MGDSSFKNRRPFKILAFSLQLLSENKEHREEYPVSWNPHFSKEFEESFLYRGKFWRKVTPYKGNIL